MAFDARKNFATTAVLTAPSPATSGTSLVVTGGGGALFPTPPFNAVVFPVSVQPTVSNAEIVRVTGITTDTFTIQRTQEGTSARTILVGDTIAQVETNKTLSDIEAMALGGTTTPSSSEAFTNKTITDTTNNVAANSLKSATTIVDVAGATAPTNGQVLTAGDSTHATWISPGASGASGRVYYPENSVNSDLNGDAAVTSTYKVASLTPSTNSESDLVIASPAANTFVFGQGYATASGQPNINTLPVGTAYRYIYASVSGGNTAQIRTDLFQYKNTGNAATTGAISLVYASAGKTITRSTGDFTADGFTQGALITISGTASNNKSVTIQTVTALVITLIPADTLVNETVSSTIVTKEKLLRSGTSNIFNDATLALQVVTFNASTAFTFALDDRIVFKWWATKVAGGGTPNITISTEGTSFASYIITTIAQANVSITSGNGMNFSTINSTGAVTMGTPGTITSTSTDATTTNSHTHAIDSTIITTATVPVKATAAELDTGTDDTKFATAKAIKDAHNVPSVVPGTSGNVLKSNGTDWTSAAPAAGVSILQVQVFT